MTAHKIDNMVSRFPESLSKAQISDINEKGIPKATTFVFGVFKGKVCIFKLYSTSQFHKRSRNCNANTKQLSTSKFDSLVGIC